MCPAQAWGLLHEPNTPELAKVGLGAQGENLAD